MKNLAAVRVVAFNRKNHAVHIHPNDWNVEIFGKKLTLKEGGTKIRYDLQTDLLCIRITDKIEETAVGKTVKRAALTGIAAHMLSQGKGMGGAMMDIALRGSETRVIIFARMVMKDTTTVSFEATKEEYETFVSNLPPHAITDEAVEEADRMISLAERMAIDGVRSLAEVDSEIDSLQKQQVLARNRHENAGRFADRDAARQEELEILGEIEHQQQLKKAAMHRLTAPPVLKRRVSLIKMVVVGATSIFCGILLIGAFSGGSQDQANDPAPAAVAEHSQPERQAPITVKTETVPQVLPAPTSQDASPKLTEKDYVQNARQDVNVDAPVPAPEPVGAIGPSFDCSKARSSVEHMICNSLRLSAEDETLAETYKKALAASANRDALKADQARWIKTERNECKDPTSLAVVYEAREKQLERMIPKQSSTSLAAPVAQKN